MTKRKLTEIVEADAPAAAAELKKLDRGPGPADAVTHTSIHDEPAEPDESEG